ncbi:unnamed protein product, partial [Ixodes hexagonus]
MLCARRSFAHVFIATRGRCRTCCSVQTHFMPIITFIVAHTTQVSMFDSIISNVCPLRLSEHGKQSETPCAVLLASCTAFVSFSLM